MRHHASAMPDAIPPGLGDLIAATRARRRLSQQALADAIGASKSSVKNWEAGRVTPSGAHLSALERALKVRFVDDAAGHYAVLELDPDAPDAPPAPGSPPVIVVAASTPEAVHALLDRLGVPRSPTE